MRELRDLAVGIGDDDVVVIRKNTDRVNLHPEPRGRDRQAVQEHAVHRLRRQEQKLPLATAARDEVGRARNYLTW